mgnify:CR=1 FL=1
MGGDAVEVLALSTAQARGKQPIPKNHQRCHDELEQVSAYEFVQQ